MTPPNVPDRVRGPRDYTENPCPPDKCEGLKNSTKCDTCGCDLCELCGSNMHWVGDGHDLSQPQYWGV